MIRLTFELPVLKCLLDSTSESIRLHSPQERGKHLLGSDQGSLCLFSTALLKSVINCSAVERTPIALVDVGRILNR